MQGKNQEARIGVVMGSSSDWPTMVQAVEILEKFDVSYEKQVVSAHRMPDDLAEYGRSAARKGLQVIIAGAGGAAHLPGMLAAHSILPVIGVPVKSSSLNGLDSLLSIVQMPGGIPVATVAIGGAKNAGLLAIQILALQDSTLAEALVAFRQQQTAMARLQTDDLVLPR